MKVLIAEDDEVSRLWLEGALSARGYEVLVAVDGDEAWNLMQQQDGPMLVIIDWNMPGLDGIELCQQMKNDPVLRYNYLIMLTGKTEPADLIEAINNGADDFIAKPFNPEELQVRVRAGSRIVELQRELIVKASHDDLTGMLNRRMLMELAEREIERSRRENGFLSLLLIDLDFFKSINDTYGHPTGDAVLCETAIRIRHGLRSVDIVGRYGGEELMVLLPQCDAETGKIIADRLRMLLSDTPVSFGGQQVSITASIGVAHMGCNLRRNLLQLIEAADQALYRAKESGRNRVEVAELNFKSVA